MPAELLAREQSWLAVQLANLFEQREKFQPAPESSVIRPPSIVTTRDAISLVTGLSWLTKIIVAPETEASIKMASRFFRLSASRAA